MKRRAFKGLVIIGAAAVGLVFLASGYRNSPTNARASTAPQGGMLKTITPYQLSQVEVSLTPTEAVPAVPASQADSVATQIFGGPVLETVLANCDLFDGSGVNAACWAVSVQPPAGPQYLLSGPDAQYNATHPVTLTFELVLVDATTGALIRAHQTNIPASAPSSS